MMNAQQSNPFPIVDDYYLELDASLECKDGDQIIFYQKLERIDISSMQLQELYHFLLFTILEKSQLYTKFS